MEENRVVKGRAYLEAFAPGSFAAVCDLAMARGGVLHMAPECFLAGYPCEDDAACLHVVFQCSELPALYRLLCALPYERVEWRRDFGHGVHYGVRRREIKDWGRKLSFAERMYDKEK
ncbi:MAG: hypothetical protein IKZ13_08600 [Akkermansia sp.]|nr:hypothetical protein [Akkermansia sp.]